jgi:nicotinamidase-related amidase
MNPREHKKGGLMKSCIFTLALISATLVAAAASERDAAADARQQPAAPTRDVLIDPGDTVVLLIDHQTGLFQTVKDVPLRDLRANTVALAKMAKLSRAPIITTASEPNGPNGPLMQELAEVAPDATFVPRKGEVNAWDNADFVRTVKATGRKTLVIAGVWTSVCVAFPALQAKADGYKVYAVIDASGDMSVMASGAAVARMAQAGIIPVTTNAILGELQRTWARPDAAAWGALYNEIVPAYRAVAESHQRALSVGAQEKKESTGH